MEAFSILEAISLLSKNVWKLSQLYYAVKGASAEMARLDETAKNFSEVLDKFKKDEKLLECISPQRRDGAARTIHELLKMIDGLQKKPEQGALGKLKRLGSHQVKKKEIESLIRAIGMHYAEFDLELSRATFTQTEKMGRVQALSQLKVVDEARIDSTTQVLKPGCHEGTREDILKEILVWGERHEEGIFWVKGMAGSGKSTISLTIARKFRESQTLAGSFFFSRDTEELKRSRNMVATIAAQLTKVDAELARRIGAAIEADVDLATTNFLDQWRFLIIKPIQEWDAKGRKLNIVVDALDECVDTETIRPLLELFSKASSSTSGKLGILLTSRPEAAIRNEFRCMQKSEHKDLALQEVPEEVVEEDIRKYLNAELKKIGNFKGLPDKWPYKREVEKLVKQSMGLFIFAATALRFIGQEHEDPESRLTLLVERSGVKGDKAEALNKIYTNVLNLSMPEDRSDSGEIRGRFKRIVGATVNLFDRLSLRAISLLLCEKKSDVNSTFSSLHSVFNIPDDENVPINALHPSFREFLIDKTRCLDQDFWVSSDERHLELFRRSLDILNGFLSRNMAGLRHPGQQLRDLGQFGASPAIPAHVEYACKYWVDHLTQVQDQLRAAEGICDGGRVHIFLSEHLLHWLEALGLSKNADKGLQALESLKLLIDRSSSPELHILVCDAIKFVTKFMSIIDDAPLQVYSSALAFSPSKSIVKAHFQSTVPSWVPKLTPFSNDWSASLNVLEVRAGPIGEIAFSPDCRQLATHSAQYTLHIWDWKGGKKACTIDSALTLQENHLRVVRALALSPDESLLAVGTANVVELFDTVSCNRDSIKTLRGNEGALGHPLPSHQTTFNRVRFNEDGRLLAAATARFCKIWDIRTDEEIHFIPYEDAGSIADVSFVGSHQIMWIGNMGHVKVFDLSGEVPRLVSSKFVNKPMRGRGDAKCEFEWKFSHNGEHLISAVNDEEDSGSLYGWKTATWERCEITWPSATMGSIIAISNDGNYLSSAFSTTIFVWRRDTNEKYTVKEHSQAVKSLSFSPDNKILASAADDQCVRILDLSALSQSDECPGESEDDQVHQLDFSENGKVCVSRNLKGQLQILHKEHDKFGPPLHCGGGLCFPSNDMKVSPDGNYVVSACTDFIEVRSTEDGSLLSTLTGHPEAIYSLAFAKKPQVLASMCPTGNIKLWGMPGNQILSIDSGQTTMSSKYWACLAISADSCLVAAACGRPGTVTLWRIKGKEAIKIQSIDSKGFPPSNKVVDLLSFTPKANFLAVSQSDLGYVGFVQIKKGQWFQPVVAGIHREIQFPEDESFFLTEKRAVTIAQGSASSNLTSKFKLWYVEGAWLCHGNESVLWLPPEIRPTAWKQKDSLIAFGLASNRLYWMEVDPEANILSDDCFRSTQ